MYLKLIKQNDFTLYYFYYTFHSDIFYGFSIYKVQDYTINSKKGNVANKKFLTIGIPNVKLEAKGRTTLYIYIFCIIFRNNEKFQGN